MSAVGSRAPSRCSATGRRTPLFLVHPRRRRRARLSPCSATTLGPDQPSYGLRARGIDDGRRLQPSLVRDGRRLRRGGRGGAAARAVRPRRVLRRRARSRSRWPRSSEAAGEEMAMLVLLDPRFRQPEGLRFREWQVRRDLGLAWHRGERSARARSSSRRRSSAASTECIRTRRTPTGIAEALERIREDYPVEPFRPPGHRRPLGASSAGPSAHVAPRRRSSGNRGAGASCRGNTASLLLPPNVDVVAAEISAALDRQPDRPPPLDLDRRMARAA